MADARASSSDSASVHAGREKKPPVGRPFFPSGLPHSDAPRGACGSQGRVTGVEAQAQLRSHPPRRRIYATKGWCAQTNSPKAMHWLTSRRQRRRHPRRLVYGAAVGDLDRCAYTAHPTESGLERDNTAADRKSRTAAPPCRAWPASRGAQSHRADFSWTAQLSRAAWQYRRYLSAQYPRADFAIASGRTDYAQAVGSAGDSS
jgi:hypothetical protein